MITVQNGIVRVQTRALTATLEHGFLTSLTAADGRALLAPFDSAAGSALQLVYASGEVVDLASARPTTIAARSISATRAEVRVHGWDGDGVLAISECEETGALLVEPSAYSSRPGVLACRWNLRGVPAEMDLVAPFYQGVKLKLDDPLVRDSHWAWPMFWEAGFVVLQGREGGFWVHARDTRYRYKAVHVGGSQESSRLGFDTEAYGPVDDSLGAGGVAWRIAPFEGDWQTPAGDYRDWLWQAYGLARREAQRPDWLHDLRLAVNWCGSSPALLDALAEQVDPKRVLIHLSDWRTDAYDENYPTFTPSDAAKAFVAKGRQMGFHIAPHANSVDMDPSHPLYRYLRDFQYRDVRTKRLHGWGWEDGVLGVPESGASLLQNRQRKVMVKIHPGLTMWRSLLAEEIEKPLDTLDLNTVFIDVTLCSGNLHNCLVEGRTSSEGMLTLIDQIASLRGGTAVGGEGLNEVTMQGLTFAQAHLYRSHQSSIEGLERTQGCPVNQFLFGRLARTTGYGNISGRTPAEVTRMETHVSLGAIPTFAGLTPDEIRTPNPAVRRLLDMAG